MREEAEQADVIVVGGGPAGLAAATELRRSGIARVIVLDREGEAGGIPRHCGHYPFGMREFHRVLKGPDYAARLVKRAKAAGVEIRTHTAVTALHPGGRLSLSTPDGLRQIEGRAVLLATGVRETSRAGRLIGGEKPGGVIPTGALQGLVYLNGQRPFLRPVIVGSELVAFSALLTCRHAGIRPLAMIEPGSRPTARAISTVLAHLMGVPVLVGTEVEEILGRDRVERVVVADAEGRREIEADGVIVTGAFRPEATLIRQSHLEFDRLSGGPAIDQYGRLSDPAYFAAGNLLRAVETAGWSWAEGHRAAKAIAAALAGRLPSPEASVRVTVDSDALKLALPQRLACGPAAPGAADRIQVRLLRPASGRLRLMRGGECLVERRIDSLPERRILLPIPSLPASARQGDDLRVVLDEG
ncbi:opine oxidase subunit A [Hartmannibacter diazotrophicus]|uniref:Opine oxidase subunit A n=1 Tax=Hartmannibacter diazotrophicus TaxID=1482074 RepID=A0A2C9DB76_9HYPH|nr:FAD/NAD(P)-binding oxidoreductase [Hartmannibacter diazotrophicus]SON57574.1 opine oxidase subunit A [Hartmannibacter diazotrophicus]